MDSRSPLEYSRNRDRNMERDREPGQALGPKREPSASPFETIARLRVPAKEVFNPRHQPGNREIHDDHKQKSAESSSAVAKERERVEVPRRPKRTRELAHAIGLNLRPEEQQLLLEVGKFRVITVADLARQLYGGNDSALRRDLQFLKENHLVETHFLNARRDGRNANVT